MQLEDASNQRLAWLAIFLLPTLVNAQGESDKSLVLVQRTVNAKYQTVSLQFSSLLSSTLTQPYVVEPNDTLQKIVSDKFAIGPAATPQIYAQMVTRIQSLNNLSNPGAIRAGSRLQLPDLPPNQWKEPNPANPNYGLPRVQGGPSYSEVFGGVGAKAGTGNAWRIFDAGRKAEPLVNQWRWITVEEAKAEAALPNLTGLTFWSQPITLKLAQVPVGLATSSTITADLQFLTSLIKRRAPQQDVVLYILDDSWPSDAAFESSKVFFKTALAAIRKANFFGDGAIPDALNDGTTKTDFPQQTQGSVLHAARIKSSLAGFSELTPRVKVIYLPLFIEQKWAKEIWQELTYTALLASAMHAKLGIAQPTEEIRKRARSDATQLVAQIPTKMINSLGPAQQTPITVLQKIAQLYAATTGVPFFISMSWTIEKREIDFGPDPDSLGVSLAASGNDSKDVITDAVYLAYRAKAAPGDVLAVMNTDASGEELCGSSRLPLGGPNPFYGLAYDGTFDGGTQCGTSFSTPRVAWLLALRQAYNAPVPRTSWPDWYASFRTSVVALQNATQSTSRRYWLSVSKLFDGV